MRTTVILLLLLFQIPINGNSQSINEDSLLNRIESADDSMKVVIYKKLSSHYERVNEEQALQYAQNGLNVAQEGQYTVLQADMLNRIGVLYMNKGDFVKSMDYYHEALKRYESESDLLGQAIVNSNMSTVALQTKKFENAKQYINKAIELDTELNDSIGIALDLGNLGAIYTAWGKQEEAFRVNLKALKIQKKINMQSTVAKTLNNLADYFINVKKNYDSAMHFILEAIAIKKDLNDDYGLAVSMLNAGIISIQTKEYKIASQYLEQANEIAVAYQQNKLLTDIYKAYSELYSETGDFENGLFYFKKYNALKDSLFNETKSKQISELEIKYESDKKEAEIAFLKKEAEYQKNLQIVIVLAVLLVIFASILGYNRMRLKNKLLSNEKQLEEEKSKTLRNELDLRNRELTSFTLNVVQKNELLQSIQEELTQNKEKEVAVKSTLKLVKANINLEEDWDSLKIHFEKVHPNFFSNLTTKYPGLSKNDQRICSYIKMKLSNKEVARMLNVDAKSIRQAHYRIKKKMGLEREIDLQQIIDQF